MLTINNEHGTISISADVLANMAGDAATSCFGVKGMVACTKDGGPWQLLRKESMSKGIIAHMNDDGSASLELHIGVDHGVNFSAVGRSIMSEVRYKLERSTGLPIRNVDVFIDAII